MIATRTPFRISFVGGGSDLRAFYARHPGCVVSTTINKYMYIFVHPYFDNRIQVKYSKTELVDNVDEIKHPIVKTALNNFKLKGIDINSIADVPAGSGLGSSSSFTTGLLHVLYAYTNELVSKETLASEACTLEIDTLKEPIGKQDQYAAAFGGLNFITFNPDESVHVEPISMPEDKYYEFQENLLMFYIGGVRSLRDILTDQTQNIIKEKQKFKNLIRMTELAEQLKENLMNGSLQDAGADLNENWQLKKSLSPKISENKIDFYYEKAIKNGALGGKLLGAGGGGFLLFYCEKESYGKLRKALSDLPEMKFKFDNYGTKLIYSDDNNLGPCLNIHNNSNRMRDSF